MGMVAALCKSHRFRVADARSVVKGFFETFGFAFVEFAFVAIGAEGARLASDAFEICGKGRHPASLNMGD